MQWLTKKKRQPRGRAPRLTYQRVTRPWQIVIHLIVNKRLQIIMRASMFIKILPSSTHKFRKPLGKEALTIIISLAVTKLFQVSQPTKSMKRFQSLSTVPSPSSNTPRKALLPVRQRRFACSRYAHIGTRSTCAVRRRKSDTTVGRIWPNRGSATRAVLSRRKKWKGLTRSKFTIRISAAKHSKSSKFSASRKSTDMTCLVDRCTRRRGSH